MSSLSPGSPAAAVHCSAVPWGNDLLEKSLRFISFRTALQSVSAPCNLSRGGHHFGLTKRWGFGNGSACPSKNVSVKWMPADWRTCPSALPDHTDLEVRAPGIHLCICEGLRVNLISCGIPFIDDDGGNFFGGSDGGIGEGTRRSASS